MEIAWWVLAYLLFASLVTYLHKKISQAKTGWPARMHAGLSKGLWYLFGAFMAGAVVLDIHGCVAATDARIYPEVVGTWYASDYIDHDYGSDSYTTPTAQIAPIVRDIETGRTLHASCPHKSTDCYEIRHNGGLKVDDTRSWSGRPFSVRYARLSVRSKPLGKTLITGLEYLDFAELPEAVKQSAIRELVCSTSVLTVWHMAKQFPAYRPQIEVAFSEKADRCKR
ncbi:hypothetical protein [Uliginosibacterium sp. 31-12]|uniref:hypothetical protein n=1 Tax=Uliginosibacterium sp. 31-12 TaxID=3062781 RepID=UPI0026E1305C|nr:hypothetical protein [Uliginosibacterium sp. 31-12]MDO6386998.1 hypothetical protein [Uliginosibacterium sp. 31-12]